MGFVYSEGWDGYSILVLYDVELMIVDVYAGDVYFISIC
jgi:hypothetical protein